MRRPDVREIDEPGKECPAIRSKWHAVSDVLVARNRHHAWLASGACKQLREVDKLGPRTVACEFCIRQKCPGAGQPCILTTRIVLHFLVLCVPERLEHRFAVARANSEILAVHMISSVCDLDQRTRRRRLPSCARTHAERVNDGAGCASAHSGNMEQASSQSELNRKFLFRTRAVLTWKWRSTK